MHLLSVLFALFVMWFGLDRDPSQRNWLSYMYVIAVIRSPVTVPNSIILIEPIHNAVCTYMHSGMHSELYIACTAGVDSGQNFADCKP